MSVRTGLATVVGVAGAALVAGFVLARPAAADVAVQPYAADVYTMSVGRVGASLAGLVGLAGSVLGGLALRRSAGGWVARNGAVVALAAGPLAMVVGALVVATAEGGLGTGNGLGGGYVALVVGLLSTSLGWLARARAHRTTV